MIGTSLRSHFLVLYTTVLSVFVVCWLFEIIGVKSLYPPSQRADCLPKRETNNQTIKRKHHVTAFTGSLFSRPPASILPRTVIQHRDCISSQLMILSTVRVPSSFTPRTWHTVQKVHQRGSGMSVMRPSHMHSQRVGEVPRP